MKSYHPGQPLDVITTNRRADDAAFRPNDPDLDLDGNVIIDFDAFNWLD